jgi:hypothetical protein
MTTRTLKIAIETEIITNGPSCCSGECQHLRGLGREWSCTLFEVPLLVTMERTPGSPLRCAKCRAAERKLPLC